MMNEKTMKQKEVKQGEMYQQTRSFYSRTIAVRKTKKMKNYFLNENFNKKDF